MALPDPGTFDYWRRDHPPSTLPGFPGWNGFDHFRRNMPFQGIPVGSGGDTIRELLGVIEPVYQVAVIEPTHITGVIGGYAP